MRERKQRIFRSSPTSPAGASFVSTKHGHGKRIIAGLIVVAVIGLSGTHLRAEEPPKRLTAAYPARPANAGNSDLPNVAPAPNDADPSPATGTVRYTDGRLPNSRPTPTLGGVQFWGDELWYRGWRIQRHVSTGHCRLLDPENRREDWGAFEHCQTRLEAIKREQNLPPLSGRVVILLHGLGGWHSTMQSLASYIEANGPFQAVNLTYPSTRADVAAHAKQLASAIDHLQGVEEINFVCHSLGNVVLRRYLSDQAQRSRQLASHPPIKRIVMLAPPNHGSERAGKWSDNELFVAIMGASAVQLGAGWAELQEHLAIPKCEFGIIAGGRGDDRGYSSRLAGDDDNTISVATTRLGGARDFVVVPVWHSFLIVSPTVQRYSLQFLEHGYFTTESRRQPIASEQPPKPR